MPVVEIVVRGVGEGDDDDDDDGGGVKEGGGVGGIGWNEKEGELGEG